MNCRSEMDEEGGVCVINEERVKDYLSGYKANQGRAGHLRVEIAQLEKKIAEMQAEAADAMAGPKAQVLTGMPRGNSTGDPTGRLGAMLADGKVPGADTGKLEAKVAQMRQELEETERACAYVEAWLRGLMDREALVIRLKMIEGMKWPKVVDNYEKRFGDAFSSDTLRRIQERAIRSIVLMTE